MTPAWKQAIDIDGHVIHSRLTMKTATVRDLRNHFARIATCIEQGEPVEITKAGMPFARLVPAEPKKPSGFKMPDIMARLKKTWGKRTFTPRQVAAMRAAELDGEEG